MPISGKPEIGNASNATIAARAWTRDQPHERCPTDRLAIAVAQLN
jgi:hypothetical protein